jgi:hypothetical protein
MGTVYRLRASEDGRTYEQVAGIAGPYEFLKALADDLATCGVYARVVKHWTHWNRPQSKTLYQVGPVR